MQLGICNFSDASAKLEQHRRLQQFGLLCWRPQALRPGDDMRVTQPGQRHQASSCCSALTAVLCVGVPVLVLEVSCLSLVICAKSHINSLQLICLQLILQQQGVHLDSSAV